MTTLHPFSTSRESILCIWSHAAQAHRPVPDAKASDLFVLLHGVLVTNIQLDDVQPTLARFIEHLEIEGEEECEWIMGGDGISDVSSSGLCLRVDACHQCPPLPEDRCLCGMEWVGRKAFERGFWKSGEEKKAELEVLEMVEGKALTDGTIEDNDEDDAHQTSSSGSGRIIIRCGVNIAGAVDGFNWVDGSKEWNVEGKLAEKVIQRKEEDQTEREGEERRRMGRRWTEDPMDVDDDPDVEADGISEESKEDESDSEEVKDLKVSFFFFGRTY